MRHYRIILLFLFLVAGLSPVCVKGQVFQAERNKRVVFTSDTIRIDTLSIIPGSLVLADTTGKSIDTSLYKIDFYKSLIILKKTNSSKILIANASYQAFPIDFSKKYFHKDVRLIRPDNKGMINPFVFTPSQKPANDPMAFEGLNKSGSIMRGISFGNNQDVVVNSALNLQMSGKLNNDVEILAAISDNNIPVQPDGTTQQIQEFDKVFIQLSKDGYALTAGDFELKRPNSYFMNFYKKAQGIRFTALTKGNPKDSIKFKNNYTNSSVAAAVSKGRFARNSINGVEGNQGPYKLKGANNELFIIVLSGTENIYVDGAMMKRGQENDYTIDYNTAEVTFTPNRRITKDSRIVIDFQYSDKNYTRSLFYGGSEIMQGKIKASFNFFSEQDARNQPVMQDMTDEKEAFLSSIGDQTLSAFYPNVDSVAFQADQVLYKLADTTVSSIYYDSIYIYSNSPDSAHYRLGFSYVGEGKGNYVQDLASVNGKVFKWIAPVGGLPQGAYEPVILLITPKRQQMFTTSFEYKPSKNTRTGYEFAVSTNDQNLFSTIDDKDNAGIAVKAFFEQKSKLFPSSKKSWTLTSTALHEFKNLYFIPIEKYRDVEFERDWNIVNSKEKNYENLSSLILLLSDNKAFLVRAEAGSFFKGEDQKAVRGSLATSANGKRFLFSADGSLLSSETTDYQTRYIRQKATAACKTPYFVFGVKNMLENNQFMLPDTASLLAGSFSFYEYETFISSADSSSTFFELSYKNRSDYTPWDGYLKRSTIADNYSLRFSLMKSKVQSISFRASYRNLMISDSALTTQQREETTLGRFEYSLRLFKNCFTSATYYQLGSGLEVKKEFYYVKVPTGQGIYSWTDYNANGVPELNEFEVAAFSDQANYIRVFTPTDEYIKSFSAQFNEALNLNPYVLWKDKKGLLKFFSRFSTQNIYHAERKTTLDDPASFANPFVSNISDTSLLSLNSSWRSSLFFNRNSAKFGLELTQNNNMNKMLMINGFDQRSQEQSGLRVRWNIIRRFQFGTFVQIGTRQSRSDYMKTKDYTVDYRECEPSLTFQPSSSFRISGSFRYTEKINTDATEKAFVRNTSLEIRNNFKKKGSLSFKSGYYIISYNSAENTSLAFEMLEGLKIGQNITWTLSYQQNLSKALQLILSYEGRKPSGTPAVHTGNVAIRAFF